MLKQINIQNFAIIDKMNIDFFEGLSVITGQTGAGKSIVIDAIEQLLGARAAQSMVADNNDYALIEGVFDYDNKIETILKDNDFILEDDYLIISKRIKSDGKSQLKLNNRLVTNELIRQLGPHLVEIHSQNATFYLNEQVAQQNFLDSLFNESEKKILLEYQNEYNNYKKLLSEQDDLFSNQIDPELLSFYQDQLKEIEDNYLTTEQVDDLSNQEAYFKEFEKISTHLTNAISLVNNQNVLESLSQVSNELSKISDVNDNFSDLASKFESIYYDLVDFNDILKSEYNSLSFDQSEFDLIKEKLFSYQRMIKKYSYSHEEVDEKIIDLNKKIDFIQNSDSLVADFKQKIAESHNKLTDLATKLTNFREKHIKEIEKKIASHLSDLYLKNANFKINLDKTELNKYGNNKVVFLFSANKGSSLKPINQVASGGELSRLMLALKIVSMDSSHKMYIFDEIDAGVSGEVADAIGLKIKEISSHNDVICITHLPQVAVYATNHLYIEKNTTKQFTTSNCYYLDEDERIEEIAKMLSGDKVSQTALDHAKELISNART